MSINFSSVILRVLLTVVAIWQLPLDALQASSVEYIVHFDATWSSSTHPAAYPIDAHFSNLVGTTHNNQVTFWELGGVASTGIERMAESGRTSTLQSEFNAAGANSDTSIRLSGIDSPGTISTRFTISQTHSLVTLVTMIAPSPDWFVGVSNLDLRSGGSWLQEVIVDLYAYDSGTDSGTDFLSDDADITPHEPISLLGSPFSGTPSLGTFTFTLQQVPEPSTAILSAIASLGLLLNRRGRKAIKHF